MYHCSSIFLNRSQGEPLLKPVTVVSSTDQPVYHSRPATRHEQDVEGEGCCHFSNNFYLTAAFGFVFAVICVFQVSILGPAAPTALNPSFYLFLDVFLSRFWLYTTYLCLQWFLGSLTRTLDKCKADLFHSSVVSTIVLYLWIHLSQRSFTGEKAKNHSVSGDFDHYTSNNSCWRYRWRN